MKNIQLEYKEVATVVVGMCMHMIRGNLQEEAQPILRDNAVTVITAFGSILATGVAREGLGVLIPAPGSQPNRFRSDRLKVQMRRRSADSSNGPVVVSLNRWMIVAHIDR